MAKAAGLSFGIAAKSGTNIWTGDFTETGSITFDFGGLGVTAASGAFPLGPTAGGGGAGGPVPEPSTWVLCALGLAFGCARRRRRLA